MLTKTHSLIATVISYHLPPSIAMPCAFISHFFLDKYSGIKSKYFPLDDLLIHISLLLISWHSKNWAILICIFFANIHDFDRFFSKKRVLHIPWNRKSLTKFQQTIIECVLIYYVIFKFLESASL